MNKINVMYIDGVVRMSVWTYTDSSDDAKTGTFVDLSVQVAKVLVEQLQAAIKAGANK